MDERYDFIAIGPRGAYALHEDDGSPDATDFIHMVVDRGHRIERVSVAEAVERHLAYLAQDPGFAKLIAGREALSRKKAE